jgi:hypothetical protein
LGNIGYIRRFITKQKHKTRCVGHYYAHTNTNNVSKTWIIRSCKCFLHPSHITILNAILLNIMYHIFKILEEVHFVNNLLQFYLNNQISIKNDHYSNTSSRVIYTLIDMFARTDRHDITEIMLKMPLKMFIEICC